MIANVFVVIRSAGERTTDLCHHLVATEVGHDSVAVVTERPFERALRVNFELALEAGRPWTLALDGDVLLRRGALAYLLSTGNAESSSTFQVQGLVCDKLLGRIRMAGVRLYNTPLLSRALEFIPNPASQQRPEAYVAERMTASGFCSKRAANWVIGLHDYEQYYVDIYRKSFVHACKFERQAFQRFGEWAKLKDQDEDYLLAMRGFSDGAIAGGFRGIDVAAYPSNIDKILGEMLSEKPPLIADDWSADQVETTLECAIKNIQTEKYRSDGIRVSGWRIAQERSRRIGWVRTGLHSVGQALIWAGSRLESPTGDRVPYEKKPNRSRCCK